MERWSDGMQASEIAPRRRPSTSLDRLRARSKEFLLKTFSEVCELGVSASDRNAWPFSSPRGNGHQTSRDTLRDLNQIVNVRVSGFLAVRKIPDPVRQCHNSRLDPKSPFAGTSTALEYSVGNYPLFPGAAKF